MFTIETKASVDAIYKDGVSIFSKEKKSLYFPYKRENLYSLYREGKLYYRSRGENVSVRSMKKQSLDPFYIEENHHIFSVK